MQFSHDKHQYYFEKYLRKEMKGEELAFFEAKLAEDQKFKEDLKYYISNREKIVETELAEYDKPEFLIEKPQKWGWVYTTISLLCLVLIGDYFLSANYSGDLQNKQTRKPLIDKINFFKKTDKIKEQGEVPKQTQARIKTPENIETIEDDSVRLYEAVDDQLVQYIEGNRLAIQGDYFEKDSLYKVVDKSVLEENTIALREKTDSLLDDSSLNVLVIKRIFRNPNLIPRQLLLEFWESPIHFRGYLFNGKKLLLYGIDPENHIYLSFSEPDNLYQLYLYNQEYQLVSDNHFHKITSD